MFKINMKFSIFMVSVFFVIYTSAGWAEEYKFTGNLSCSNIGPRHPKQSAATGDVSFQFDATKQELTYIINVEKIKDVYMAHLHVGPCNEKTPIDQGPIAAWLYPRADHDTKGSQIEGEFTGILAKGVIRQEDLKNDITFEDLIAAMRNGNAYTNVHTRAYITGEICGRIKPQE